MGLLSNIPGDAKPVPVIEDTAVDVQDLPEYIKEFNEFVYLLPQNMICLRPEISLQRRQYLISISINHTHYL